MVTSFLSIWGTVSPPQGPAQYGSLGDFLGNIIRAMIIIAGIYAVLNFILAGYTYLSAGGDPKKVAQAGAQIWQSMIGLLIVVGSYIIAAIISNILFGNPNQIFNIEIQGP